MIGNNERADRWFVATLEARALDAAERSDASTVLGCFVFRSPPSAMPGHPINKRIGAPRDSVA